MQLSLPGHNVSRVTDWVTRIKFSWENFSLPLAHWKMHLILQFLHYLCLSDRFTQASLYIGINVRSSPTCRRGSYANSAEVPFFF